MASKQALFGDKVLMVYTDVNGFDLASGVSQAVATGAGAGNFWGLVSFQLNIATTTSAGGDGTGLTLETAAGDQLVCLNNDATIQGDGATAANLDPGELPKGITGLFKIQPVANTDIVLKNHSGRVTGRYSGMFIKQKPDAPTISDHT